MASVIQYSDAVSALVRKRNMWYEKVPFTYGPYSMVSGTNSIFTASTLAPGIPDWQTTLTDLAVTNTYPKSFITVNVDGPQFGGNSSTGSLAAFRAGLRPDPRMRASTINRLSVSITGDAAHASQNLNYAVEMQRLTLASKRLIGGSVATQLTPDERAAAAWQPPKGQSPLDVASGVQKGYLPIPISAQIERTFLDQIIQVQTVWLYGAAIGTNDTSIGQEISPVRGIGNSFMVIREIGVENDPSTAAAPTANLGINSDSQTNYVGLNCQALAGAISNDAPLDTWIPCQEKIAVTASANSGTPNVPVRLVIWHIAYSDLIRVRFGLAHPPDVPERTYYSVFAGVA